MEFFCENPDAVIYRPPLKRGLRQWLYPTKPTYYPSENWAWQVGEAIKQGEKQNLKTEALIRSPKPSFAWQTGTDNRNQFPNGNRNQYPYGR